MSLFLNQLELDNITTLERNALTLPKKGLLIFNVDTNQHEYNSGTPASPVWSSISGSAPVVSVNGKTGVVVLNADDIDDSVTLHKFVTAGDLVKLSNLSGVNSGDQTITLTTDVTGSGTGSFAATISNNAVTNSKAADMPANSVKVNNTNSVADPNDVSMPPNTFLARLATGNIIAATVAQATALLNVFTSVLKGLVPPSGGGTTNFLRADGVWAAPPSSGGFLTSTNSPAQITADQNNYSPSGLLPNQFLRINSDANHDITGIDSTGFSDRDTLVVINIGSFDIKLKENDANSLAANRLLINADITIQDEEAVTLIYDGTSSKWRCIGEHV